MLITWEKLKLSSYQTRQSVTVENLRSLAENTLLDLRHVQLLFSSSRGAHSGVDQLNVDSVESHSEMWKNRMNLQKIKIFATRTVVTLRNVNGIFSRLPQSKSFLPSWTFLDLKLWAIEKSRKARCECVRQSQRALARQNHCSHLRFAMNSIFAWFGGIAVY